MSITRNVIRFLTTISFSLCLLTGTVHAEDRSSRMTNNSIGTTFSESEVVSPANYYAARTKTLALVRQERWQAAKPLLESLTGQYPDDGDTWYVLALTYFQLGEWEKSIKAFRQTLALGTILSGIPTGSAPSNDIMIKIAQAYAELNNETEAVAWIHNALEARYDGRHRLAQSPHFKNIVNATAFKKATGSFLPSDLSRVQAWRFDLEFLVSEIHRLHVNVYHAISKKRFEKMVTDIFDEIPSLSDQEIVFRFMKLVAALGNGHNFIIPTFNDKGAFQQLPLQFYKFSDGLFVVAADEPFSNLIGNKVVAIEDTEIDDALLRTTAVNARDNEMQTLWLGPHYLSLPQVLKGLKITTDIEKVSLTLEDDEGTVQKIKLAPREMRFNGFPKLPAVAKNDVLHNLRIEQQYWYEHIPKKQALYIQYNYVHNNPALSFEEFNIELKEQLSAKQVQNLIVDIRHNAGGDGSTYPPLLKTLVQFEALNPRAKIFVIQGRNTFSAAHNLLLDINRLTNAILVGEPSGSRPNALSEAGWFKLPYSGTLGIISSQYHQASKAEDHRVWVAPHVPTSLSSKQYFAGKDPSIEAIFQIIDANGQ